ncbi:MAG: helix-turn-helix domain-containing protein [Candidatus Dormibacteria bacterium]
MAEVSAAMVEVNAGGLVVVIEPKALLTACAARGFSLAELRQRAGISRPTMIQAMRGRPVRPRTAWKLARALSATEVPPALEQLLAGQA